jgi:hypothetical protein
MRPPHELFERTFTANARKPNASTHRVQYVGAQAGLLERSAAGLFYFGEGAVDSDAQRGRAGNAGAKHDSVRVLNARTASRAATVDPDEQGRS